MAWTLIAEGPSVAAGQEIDRAEVRRALTVLADPGGACELRGILGPGRAASRRRFGADLDGLVEDAAELGEFSRGVYYALNPGVMGLAREQATKDGHVLYRRWLMIDVDPTETPANKNQNATEAERRAASSVAGEVLAYLSGEGWPEPVGVDSGRGVHLLYRVHLANDDEARDAVRDFLVRLAARFDAPGAAVDRKVFNASRIAKLPGTWARKGPDLPDRPQRVARLISVPDAIDKVSLKQISETVPKPMPPSVGIVEPNDDPFAREETPTPDLRAEAHLEDEVAERERAAGYAEAVARARRSPANGHAPRPFPRLVAEGDGGRDAWDRAVDYVNACPGAVSGQNGHGTTMSVARGVVWGFGLGAAVGYDLLASHYNPGCSPPWSDRELRHKCADADKPDPHGRPRNYHLDAIRAGATVEQLAASDAGPSAEPPPPGKVPASVKTYRADELVAMELPEARWVVPGLLSEGMTILAGKPKLGKSFMALGLALTVAYGGKVLGNIQSVPGDVLYLSLEDKLRRLQDRLWKVLKGLDHAAPRRLHLAVEWPRQGKGGLEAIERWAQDCERPSLVIVDVLARFKTPQPVRGNAYEQDYAAVSQIKERLDKLSLSSLHAHHCKKAKEEDAYDEISGTQGIGGAADGAMILTRSRTDTGGKLVEGSLFITGRDIEEKKLAVSFDPATFCWTSMGEAEARVESVLGKRIIDLLKANGPGVHLTPADVAGQLDADPHRVRTYLGRLATSGVVERIGATRYRWPVGGGTDDSPF